MTATDPRVHVACRALAEATGAPNHPRAVRPSTERKLMNTRTRIALSASVIAGLLLTGTACTSDADKVSENLSVAAEQFEVQRSIIGVNAITDTPAFEVEGRCSIERVDDRLQVTCKHGDNDYRKHELGLADNVYYASVQLEGVDASVYHTRILIKPENLVPEFDLEAGEQ